MTNAHAHHDYDGEDACWTTAFRGCVVDSREMARAGMKGHLMKELTMLMNSKGHMYHMD